MEAYAKAREEHYRALQAGAKPRKLQSLRRRMLAEWNKLSMEERKAFLAKLLPGVTFK